MPNSLTLGGYDANRFVPHNVTFNLNIDQQPQVFVNSISVVSAVSSNNWSVSTELLYTSDRVSAIVDSSTPYLWLPRAACDRFAESLGLTYDDSLNLYTFASNSTQQSILQNSQLSFTFGLSDIATTPYIVNITLPYMSFDLQLQYPAIPGTQYGQSNATQSYFPLRRATNAAQYTIGRAFLQEAYIITDYDRNTFSVHQAVQVSDPLQNISIVSILRPSTNTLPGSVAANSKRISTKAIVGIAVGAVMAGASIIILFVWLCKRRVKKKANQASEKPASIEPGSIMSRFRRQRPPLIHEATGSTTYPTEVGADATHERFELPAPLGPAELDSESGTLDGTTEHGSSTQDSANLTEYERGRRKLARHQFRPARAPPIDESYPAEKTETGTSQISYYRDLDTPNHIESPPASPFVIRSGDSMTISGQPSPVSPGFVSTPTSPTSPPPRYRRISPSNVVYAGRLPDNVQLPGVVPRPVGLDGRTLRYEETNATEPTGTNSSLGSHYTQNEEVGEDRYGDAITNSVSPIASGINGMGSASGSISTDTNIVSPIASRSSGSGSNGANVSDEAMRNVTRSRSLRDMPNRRGDVQIQEMLNPRGNSPRFDGENFIHIPQPAENRFSWEEERISGNDERTST